MVTLPYKVKVHYGRLEPLIVQYHPKSLFVFGDNLIRKGLAGQACIRVCDNSFGIATKRLPAMSEESFFKDRDDEYQVVKDDVAALVARMKTGEYDEVVFPSSGIGSGLAQLKVRSKGVWEVLRKELIVQFGFDNTLCILVD